MDGRQTFTGTKTSFRKTEWATVCCTPFATGARSRMAYAVGKKGAAYAIHPEQRL